MNCNIIENIWEYGLIAAKRTVEYTNLRMAVYTEADVLDA